MLKFKADINRQECMLQDFRKIIKLNLFSDPR